MTEVFVEQPLASPVSAKYFLGPFPRSPDTLPAPRGGGRSLASPEAAALPEPGPLLALPPGAGAGGGQGHPARPRAGGGQGHPVWPRVVLVSLLGVMVHGFVNF